MCAHNSLCSVVTMVVQKYFLWFLLTIHLNSIFTTHTTQNISLIYYYNKGIFDGICNTGKFIYKENIPCRNRIRNIQDGNGINDNIHCNIHNYKYSIVTLAPYLAIIMIIKIYLYNNN